VMPEPCRQGRYSATVHDGCLGSQPGTGPALRFELLLTGLCLHIGGIHNHVAPASCFKATRIARYQRDERTGAGMDLRRVCRQDERRRGVAFFGRRVAGGLGRSAAGAASPRPWQRTNSGAQTKVSANPYSKSVFCAGAHNRAFFLSNIRGEGAMESDTRRLVNCVTGRQAQPDKR
jgi:hypothetical protein